MPVYGAAGSIARLQATFSGTDATPCCVLWCVVVGSDWRLFGNQWRASQCDQKLSHQGHRRWGTRPSI